MLKILNYFENACTYLAICATFSMMLLTTTDAVVRYLFDSPIIGAYEITERYLMIMACFFGITYSYREGSYVRVTFVVDQVPKPLKHIANYFVQIFCCILGVLFLIATIKMTLMVYARSECLDILNFIPLWPSYAIVTVGFFFLSLRMIIDIFFLEFKE